MALIHIDGFDKYGPLGYNHTANIQARLTTDWTVTSGGDFWSIAAPLSATGQSLRVDSNTSSGATWFLSKSIGANASRLIGGLRFNINLIKDFNIEFYENATLQCYVSFVATTGAIKLMHGSGTTIGTSGSTVAASTNYYVEFDLTFSNTGAYNIYIDGVSVLSGTGDLTNSANAYATAMRFGGRTGSGVQIAYVDDFYLLDTSGSTNNAVLLTNPRIETQFPTGDDSVAFTVGQGVFGATGAYQGSTSTNAPGANQLALRKYVCGANETLDSIKILPAATSASAKFKAVVYANSGGAPSGAPLDTGTEVTGTTSGTILSLPLTTPQALTSGSTYWIGFITDTSVVLSLSDSNSLGYKAANTYGSGAPSGPTMTATQSSWIIYGATSGITGNNWKQLANNPQLGDASYNTSSVINDEDLFDFPTLSVIPDTIHTVAVKAHVRRGAGTTPTIDLRTKSSATTASGSHTGISVDTSYTVARSFFDTDPNTGVTWTDSGVNAAKSGLKVMT